MDSSADKMLGAFLFNKDKKLLYDLAVSNALKLVKMLLNHEHDLTHKAAGWMLTEVGNRNFEVAFDFLKYYYRNMHRAMLRYAIERFPPELRQKFMKGLI